MSTLTESPKVRDVRLLAGSSLVYAIGTFGVRAIGILLLPFYTRYLTPADYGVIGVASAVISIFLVLATLSLHASVTYLFFQAKGELERRRSIGAVWVGLALSAVSLTIASDWLGDRFGSAFFREVPFEPYLRLAIWIALLTSFSLIPLNLLQAMERPRSYVALILVGTVVTTGLMIWQVVFREAGAQGYLRGMLLGGLFMLIPYLVVTLRNVRPNLDLQPLKFALVYGLPLIPHGLAAWLLELSDRVILERFVSLTDLGVYSLGYLLSSVIHLLGAAINNAWVPYMFRRLADEGDSAKSDLAVFTTYYFVLISWSALGLALLSKVALVLLATKAYFGAASIMPWVIAGMVMHAMYVIPVGFLFREKRTVPIAVASVSASLLNLGANLVLIPRYGIAAAAFATFLSYFVLLFLVWLSARRVSPIPYEYPRLAIVAAVALSLFFVGNAFSMDSIAAEATAKGALWMVLPATLWLSGFVRPRERQIMRLIWQRPVRNFHGEQP